jgi:MOSC domain-containing protein YiiM
VTLEVTSPRIPCWKLEDRIGEPGFIKRFGDARRPGAYLRIIEPGVLEAGDDIEVVSTPSDHEVTVGLINEVRLHAPQEAFRLLAAPSLPPGWRRWAERHAAGR